MKFLDAKGLRGALAVAAMTLALAGCGRNGAPLPPPGISEDQAVPYLNENTTGSANPNNSAADQQTQKSAWPQQDSTQPAKATVVKPPRPFFLDPLL